MRINLAACFATFVLGMALSPAAGRAASIQLSPSTLFSYDGGTDGFGFSFANDTGWAVLGYTALVQQFGGYGSYTDFIGSQSQFLIVAPGATFTQGFNQATRSGAGAYTFFSSTRPGTTVRATLTLFYDVYSVDPNTPNFDPFADYVSSNQVSAPVTLGAVAVPEPEYFAQAAAGLLLVALETKRQRR